MKTGTTVKIQQAAKHGAPHLHVHESYLKTGLEKH